MSSANVSGSNTEFLLGPESVVSTRFDARKYLRLVRRKIDRIRKSGRCYNAEAFFTRPGFDLTKKEPTFTARNVLVAASTVPLVFVIAVLFVSATFGAPTGNKSRLAATDESAVLAQPPVNLTAEGSTTASARGAGLVSQISANGVVIPEGFTPGAIALDGDRLAVRVDGPEGAKVLIYDLNMGGVI